MTAHHLRLVGQLGLPPHVLMTERLVDRHCGMCGIAVSHDVLGWVDDVRSCARHGSDAYFGLQCHRVLAISLPHGGRFLGIYNLFFETDATIAPQTEAMLRLMGQLLGLSLAQRADRA